jgi:hypothetical protein
MEDLSPQAKERIYELIEAKKKRKEPMSMNEVFRGLGPSSKCAITGIYCSSDFVTTVGLSANVALQPCIYCNLARIAFADPSVRKQLGY